MQADPTRRPRFTGVRLLCDNTTAWQAKRHLIATARRTLDLSYFILEVDATTSRLMLDLVQAAQRGVKVRLMLDYFTTFSQAPALRTLGAQRHLQVRRYGTPTPTWLNALKLAGIDPVGFVTGMMATSGPRLAESLKGCTLFAPAAAEKLRSLPAEPGDGGTHFPLQVLAALGGGGADAEPQATARSARDQAAKARLAVALQVLIGLKHFLHRNHHKLLLADGTRFLMGGRNLADAYHDPAPSQGHAFQDTDLMARDGRAGGSGHAATFQRLWDSDDAVDIAEPDPLDARGAMPLPEIEARARPVAARRPGTAFRGGTPLPPMDGRLLDNLPHPAGDTTLTQAYIACFRRLLKQRRPATVDIVNAYVFLQGDAAASAALFELRNAMVQAVAAGHTVNLYTNSEASTDLPPVNHAAYPQLARLIRAGVRVFELDKGQGSLHTKAAAFGDRCLVVGSYNLDARSELYDTNNLIVLQDRDGKATAAFRRLRVRALKWTRLTAEAADAAATGSTPSAQGRIFGPVL